MYNCANFLNGTISIYVGITCMQNTYMDGETVDHRIHTIRPQEATKHYIRKFQTENSSVIDLIFEQQRKYIFLIS